MSNSNSGTTSPDSGAVNESGGESRRNGSSEHHSESDLSLDTDYAALVEQAKTWVEDNQTAAMLGGFGFGVFIGVLLRR